MKKIIVFISFILAFSVSYSQHEGIERHFKSFTMDITEYENFTYVDDTLTDNFHNYLPQQKLSYNPLGSPNPGTPFIPAVFSDQTSHTFWFLNNYTPYIQQHDNIIYFDATKPFTLFKFSGGAKEQELVSFLHTQNISPTFNFAFNYDIINSKGHYQFNKSKVNALSLATAYTKKKYQSHFNFIYNRVNHLENGGLEDAGAWETTNYNSDLYSVNLEKAENTIGQVGFQYNQEFRFGSYTSDTIIFNEDTAINKVFGSHFSIIHDIKADKFYRIYEDVPGSFYSTIYRDSLNTFDSTYYKVIDNKILLNFLLEGKGKIEKFQVLAGINNYFYNYGFDSTSQSYLSNYVTGMLKFDTKKSAFNAKVNYCFAGTDIFDTDISADYGLNLSEHTNLSAYFGFSVLNPSIFMYYYKSNHFEWDIDAFKTSKISTGGTLNLSKYNLNIGTNVNMLDNYFVFNTLAMPVQIPKANLIADVFISKQFNFRKFHWFTKLTYQYISDRAYVPLPEFIGYSDIYFISPLFKNALTLQLGFDVKYHSSVYGYSYMPALGAFYLQNENKSGNYPNAGFYGVVKIKRLRGFFKISNFNSTFMPRTYYLITNIPDNPFSFNFGISWEFYD